VNKVKVAIIGAGRQANQAHYPSLAAMEDVEIVGMCDLDDERLHSTADHYEIEHRYTNYQKMLAETQPDAVYVIMEVHLLYDIAYHVLTNGYHLFIEKPPFLTRFQAESMARIADKYDRLTMVGFERRFVPLMVETRKLIEDHTPIAQARAAVFKNHVDLELPYHRGSIDFLTTDGVHCVDWLRWACGGEVKHVVSKVRKMYQSYDNSYNAMIEFDNGAIGELSCSWAMGNRQWLFEMHAREVSAYLNATDGADQVSIYAGESISKDWQWRKEGDAYKRSLVEAAGSPERFRYYGFYAENRHFIDCIKEGKQPQTNFADGVKTMALIEQIYHSQI
jgi:predicted dehydrogenase